MIFSKNSQLILEKWCESLQALNNHEHSPENIKFIEACRLAASGDNIKSGYIVVITASFHRYVIGNKEVVIELKEDIESVYKEMTREYKISMTSDGIEVATKKSIH